MLQNHGESQNQNVVESQEEISFCCVGCEEQKGEDDVSCDYPSHWNEPLTMGNCLVCEVQFGCAGCCGGWTFQERHYCSKHEDQYDSDDELWKETEEDDDENE